jgi:hypothetical protein
MKIVATPMTAAIAGVWMVVGMGSAQAWETHHSVHIPFVLLSVVFFLVPSVLFVGGLDKISLGLRRDYFMREDWDALKAIGLRGLCWFLSAVVSGILYTYFVYLIRR